MELLAERPSDPEHLAAALGVHPRTASRLLGALIEEGWAVHDSVESDTHRLSTRVVRVARSVLSRSDIIRLATPLVAALRDASGEASHLSIPEGGWAVHVVESSSIHPLTVATDIGVRVPLHATAVGKSLAAHRIDQLGLALVRGLERFTDRTITELADLEGELEAVRMNGFAVDNAELTPDTRCVAAPVRDGWDVVVGAIGLSGLRQGSRRQLFRNSPSWSRHMLGPSPTLSVARTP